MVLEVKYYIIMCTLYNRSFSNMYNGISTVTFDDYSKSLNSTFKSGKEGGQVH